MTLTCVCKDFAVYEYEGIWKTNVHKQMYKNKNMWALINVLKCHSWCVCKDRGMHKFVGIDK